MEIKKLTNADAGCIYDSHNGHYIIPFVIGYAHDAGRQTDPFVLFALSEYADNYHDPVFPNDALIEEHDQAIIWLNQNVAPDGFIFEWNDGDFGLYSVDEYGEWADPEEFAQQAKKGEDD